MRSGREAVAHRKMDTLGQKKTTSPRRELTGENEGNGSQTSGAKPDETYQYEIKPKKGKLPR